MLMVPWPWLLEGSSPHQRLQVLLLSTGPLGPSPPPEETAYITNKVFQGMLGLSNSPRTLARLRNADSTQQLRANAEASRLLIWFQSAVCKHCKASEEQESSPVEANATVSALCLENSSSAERLRGAFSVILRL
jgi:hypothetical protein